MEDKMKPKKPHFLSMLKLIVVDFNQPTNRIILATDGTFCNHLNGTKSGYFEQHHGRASSCVCGDKTWSFKGTVTKKKKNKSPNSNRDSEANSDVS